MKGWLCLELELRWYGFAEESLQSHQEKLPARVEQQDVAEPFEKERL